MYTYASTCMQYCMTYVCMYVCMYVCILLCIYIYSTWGCVKIPCPSAYPSKPLSFYFTLIVLQGLGVGSTYIYFPYSYRFRGFWEKSEIHPHLPAQRTMKAKPCCGFDLGGGALGLGFRVQGLGFRGFRFQGEEGGTWACFQSAWLSLLLLELLLLDEEDSSASFVACAFRRKRYRAFDMRRSFASTRS